MDRLKGIMLFLMLLSVKVAFSGLYPPKDSVIIVVTTKGDSILITPKHDGHSRRMFDIDSLQDRIYADTIMHNYIRPDSTKNSKHISNLIARNLFSSPTASVDSTLQKISKFNQFEGKIIDSVVIIRDNVFEEDPFSNKSTQFLRKTANSLNYLTRESTIKRYLLFKKGDRVVPDNLIKSEALLREMSSIAKAYIRLEEDSDGHVTAYVSTTDSWSIMLQFYYRTTNNGMLRISDYDFLGTGNRLDLNEYYNMKNKEYFKAVELNYFIPNAFGKFIEVNIGGGYGKTFHSAILSADKYFVRPTDWAGGARYIRRREERNIDYEDIFVPVDKQTINVWFGQSVNISKKWGDNMFFTAKAEDVKFYERPYHTATYSPLFHNYFDLLASFGLYKEKFYRGNLIYGYGRTESIPFGYKAEIIGGYRKGEYDSAPYIGTDLSIGNIVKLGYISAKISFGTFIGNTPSLHNTKLDVGLLYFTKLQQFKGDLSMRQFINVNYSSGIRSLDGYKDEFGFQNNNKLGSVAGGVRGTTRLRINPESVFFTPLHISGFKFALFGFTDFGTIGYSVNPFANNFYAAAGCGVRIRNESLIFKTVQFRIVISIKGNPEFRNNLFYLNSETPLRANRYIPMEPQILKLY